MEVLMLYSSPNGNHELEEIAQSMHDDIFERSSVYFKNPLLLAASYMDPRYRSFLFIKDQNQRSRALFDASSFIKNVSKQY